MDFSHPNPIQQSGKGLFISEDAIIANLDRLERVVTVLRLCVEAGIICFEHGRNSGRKVKEPAGYPGRPLRSLSRRTQSFAPEKDLQVIQESYVSADLTRFAPNVLLSSLQAKVTLNTIWRAKKHLQIFGQYRIPARSWHCVA